MSDVDIPGTSIKARISEYGITLVDPGMAWSPGSTGATGNQLVGPLAPEKVPALIQFLAGYLDDYLRKRKAN